MSKERRKATINGNEDAFKEQGNRAMKMPTKSEWSTDFTDHSKYKLSESEMIQKKAACQSKHREEARNLVQERTKKLEMGIVDDDTRKVYETALAAKNIDMNQPVRK